MFECKFFHPIQKQISNQIARDFFLMKYDRITKQGRGVLDFFCPALFLLSVFVTLRKNFEARLESCLTD